MMGICNGCCSMQCQYLVDSNTRISSCILRNAAVIFTAQQGIRSKNSLPCHDLTCPIQGSLPALHPSPVQAKPLAIALQTPSSPYLLFWQTLGRCIPVPSSAHPSTTNKTKTLAFCVCFGSPAGASLVHRISPSLSLSIIDFFSFFLFFHPTARCINRFVRGEKELRARINSTPSPNDRSLA